MKMLLVLAPTMGLTADVLAHLVVTWALRSWGIHTRMVCAAIVGGATTVFISLLASARLGLNVWTASVYVAFALTTFVLFAFGYFNFVQMNLSSLRLRIANELIDEPDGVSAERLFASYSGHAIVDARLERLGRKRQIILRDGRYYHCFSVVYLIAVAMDAMKRLVFRRRIRDGFLKPSPQVRPGDLERQGTVQNRDR